MKSYLIGFFIYRSDGSLVKDFEMNIEGTIDSLKDRCQFLCQKLLEFDGLSRGFIINNLK